MKTKITIFYYTSITSETIIWYDTYISEVNQQSVFFLHIIFNRNEHDHIPCTFVNNAINYSIKHF